jgi:hypothetical protein
LEQRAKANGQDVKTFVESLVQGTATESVDELPTPAPASDAEFEADMRAFAEGTEHLPSYPGRIRAPTSTLIMIDGIWRLV